MNQVTARSQVTQASPEALGARRAPDGLHACARHRSEKCLRRDAQCCRRLTRHGRVRGGGRTGRSCGDCPDACPDVLLPHRSTFHLRMGGLQINIPADNQLDQLDPQRAAFARSQSIGAPLGSSS